MGNKLRSSRPLLRSILLYGEGPTDEAFLRHLSYLYCPRNCGKRASHDNAHGGGANGAAKKALQAHKGIGYIQKVLLIDGDTILSVSLKNELASNGWVIFVPEPCIEGMLLDILEPKWSHATWSTPQCKDEFNQKYINETEKSDYRAYSVLFSKSVIDREIKRIETLKRIVEILLS